MLIFDLEKLILKYNPISGNYFAKKLLIIWSKTPHKINYNMNFPQQQNQRDITLTDVTQRPNT